MTGAVFARTRQPLSRRPKALTLGVAMFAVLVTIAVFAPWITMQDPTALNPANRVQPPSAQAWFGTDMLGRDIFARTVHGARLSLFIGASVAVSAVALGVLIGLAADCHRWVELTLMRMMDALMSIPPLLLAVALMTLMRGGSVAIVIFAITLAEVPRMARLSRASVLAVRQQPFILAAVACGTSPAGIIRAHILPNIMGTVAVQGSYIFASAMILEAVLGFIGAGVPSAVPSWGNIMSEGRSLWQISPGVIFFPAAMLSLTVLAVNMIGDGLTGPPRAARGIYRALR